MSAHALLHRNKKPNPRGIAQKTLHVMGAIGFLALTTCGPRFVRETPLAELKVYKNRIECSRKGVGSGNFLTLRCFEIIYDTTTTDACADFVVIGKLQNGETVVYKIRFDAPAKNGGEPQPYYIFKIDGNVASASLFDDSRSTALFGKGIKVRGRVVIEDKVGDREFKFEKEYEERYILAADSPPLKYTVGLTQEQLRTEGVGYLIAQKIHFLRNEISDIRRDLSNLHMGHMITLGPDYEALLNRTLDLLSSAETHTSNGNFESAYDIVKKARNNSRRIIEQVENREEVEKILQEAREVLDQEGYRRVRNEFDDISALRSSDISWTRILQARDTLKKEKERMRKQKEERPK